jgi:hypothetical protein
MVLGSGSLDEGMTDSFLVFRVQGLGFFRILVVLRVFFFRNFDP